jgi:hypothetical protein
MPGIIKEPHLLFGILVIDPPVFTREYILAWVEMDRIHHRVKYRRKEYRNMYGDVKHLNTQSDCASDNRSIFELRMNQC